jgi:Zn-dependent protease
VGLGATFILFTSLFLHELAHAAVGSALRRPVREIAITLFGAHTAFTRPADSALASGLVAAVGPATNAAIAGAVAAVGWLVQPLGSTPLFQFVVTLNLVLAAFNALPGYPLDGGRVVEAIVWAISGRQRVGTIVAAWGGLAVAIGAVAYFARSASRLPAGPGATDWVWGAMIGLMIGLSSFHTLRDLRAIRRAERTRLSDFVRGAAAVRYDASVEDAVLRAREAGVDEIVVLSSRDRPAGHVSLSSALKIPEERRRGRSLDLLGDPLPDGAEIEVSLGGEELLMAVRCWRERTTALAVMDDGEVVGVVLLAEVGERLK